MSTMFGNWAKGKRMTQDQINAKKKKDLRKQIKEVNDKIIAIETGIETDEYNTPSLATLEKEVEDEEDADSDDRNIAELEKELEDANKKLSEANAEEEELNEMQEESDNDIILATDKTLTKDHAEQNKCLEKLIKLLTTRINEYKESDASSILIYLDSLLLKRNIYQIKYNNKMIELAELKKRVKKDVEDENMANFNKSISETREIINYKAELDKKITRTLRIHSIRKELLAYNRMENNPKYKQKKLLISKKIISLTGELEGLIEQNKTLKEKKGGRTRRMKKNVKKITNKKKTSIKAKTRRIRRRITTCRGRKTFRRRN